MDQLFKYPNTIQGDKKPEYRIPNTVWYSENLNTKYEYYYLVQLFEKYWNTELFVTTWSDGVGKVSDGIGKVSDGVKKVSDDVVEVRDGFGKVADGVGKDGVWKVSENPNTEYEYYYLAQLFE